MMALHWCWLSSFVTSITKKPYIFEIFQGGPDPPVLPLDPHMSIIQEHSKKTKIQVYI